MNDILRSALRSRGWPLPLRYVLTALAVLAAHFFRAQLLSDSTSYPFLLFYPVVIVASLFLDRGNGIFASALSSYFLIIDTSPSNRGSAFDIAIILFLITNLIVAVFIEATHKFFISLMEANEQITTAARSRGVLLRELAHRTRNDMAALNSLFSLQAHTLKDPAAQKAFEGAAERTQILSRVHERLSIEENSVVIDSKRFITDLCRDLQLSRLKGRPIALEISVESHQIDHQSAVAIGLIINELLTNSLKYAFPGNRAGKTAVGFKRDAANYELRVSDNGIGLQKQEVKGTGLGLDLVRTLAAQLRGELREIDCPEGACFAVTFPTEIP